MQKASKASPISKDTLIEFSEKMFGGLVKGVVDVRQRVVLFDAEMHVDLEQALLEACSNQQDLWGINVYPEEKGEDFLEFDSMINIRPNQGNKTRGVEDPEIQKQIRDIVTESVSI